MTASRAVIITLEPSEISFGMRKCLILIAVTLFMYSADHQLVTANRILHIGSCHFHRYRSSHQHLL